MPRQASEMLVNPLHMVGAKHPLGSVVSTVYWQALTVGALPISLRPPWLESSLRSTERRTRRNRTCQAAHGR